MRTKAKAFALVGNPNSGKTTLYNLLTKSGDAVGNRAGVTFEPKASPMRRFGDSKNTIIDLPGIYSLTPYGNEEVAASRFLSSGQYDGIINIADATNLERSLLLTLQLLARGARLILALNMMDEAEKEQIHIDIPALSRALGIPVFPISAAKNSGIDALIHYLLHNELLPASPLCDGEDSRGLLDTVQSILKSTVTKALTGTPFSDRIDRLLCRPYFGIPFFFAVIFAVFLLTFSGIGSGLTALLDRAFMRIGDGLSALLIRLGTAEYTASFITDGIFHGVCSVLSFMPQTAILFLLLALLEDSGYMARASFVMDGALRALGLSGKAFIPILVGFGCTVPAVMSASTLSDEEKETAVLSLPFIPCSARFPVFLMIISAFFKRYAAVAAFFVYLLGIAVAVLSAFLHTHGKPERAAPPLVLELPKYRLPRFISLTREVGGKLRDYIIRAGTTVFLSCVVIYILSTVAPDFSIAADGNESILARIGSLFVPLFSPIGLTDGRLLSALAAGFFAKESIVSTVEILIPNGIETVLSTAGAASFTVFSLLYAPCVATLSAAAGELGKKKAAYLLVRCLVFGYAAALLTYLLVKILHGTI